MTITTLRQLTLTAIACCLPWYAAADGLPSWHEGPAKTAIVDFVAKVTAPDSARFVPERRRIAVFDNDGTLWAEKPFYFQLFFAMERLGARAEADPSILSSDVLKAAADGNLKGALAEGEHGLIEIVSASQTGLSVPEFQAEARHWLSTARHPDSGRPYTDMIYQPMLELLSFLRDNGFKTYIVSGGGVDLMRAFAEDLYGIPPYQVIGSMGNARYELMDGGPAIVKQPGIFFVDDKADKPVAISRQIGIKPIFVAGNSDGDFQMLEWATAGDGPALGLIVHHTDAEREWAYDRQSAVGRLDRGLDEGPKRGWIRVDMKRDWSRVFPWQQAR